MNKPSRTLNFCLLMLLAVRISTAQPERERRAGSAETGRPMGPLLARALHVLGDTALAPGIDSVVPDRAGPGTEVTLTVFGPNLRLSEAARQHELCVGENLRVPLAVVPPGYLQARLRIPADEPPGPRAVAVKHGKRTVASRTDAFTIVTRPRPDWRLASPIAEVTADNVVAARVTVENSGTGAAPATVVRVRLKSGRAAEAVKVPELAPGAGFSFRSMLSLPDAQPGTEDSVVFELAPRPEEDESNRADNRAAVWFRLGEPPRPGRPDLAVSILSWRQSDDGATLALRVQLANVGDAVADASQVEVSFVPDLLAPARMPVDPVPAGQDVTRDFAFGIPAAARGRTLLCRAAVASLADEPNPDNNTATREIHIRPPDPPHLPNFTLTNPGYRVSRDRRMVLFSVDVTNTGDNTSGPARLHLSSATGALAGSIEIPPLVPHSSERHTMELPIPDELRGTTVELTAQIDPENRVAELDNDDNLCTLQVALPMPATAIPWQPIAGAGGAAAAAAGYWALRVLGRGRTAKSRRRHTTRARRPETGRQTEAASAGAAAGTTGEDNVYFTVTNPTEVAPRASFIVDFWIHLETQRDEVLRRVQEVRPDTRPAVQSEGPFAIARDTELQLRVEVEDCIADPATKAMRWTGAIARTAFLLRVKDGASEGSKAGRFSVACSGVEIALVPFVLRIAASPTETGPVAAAGQLHRRAFASYAREDAREALSCIQGMTKAVPGLDVFVDVVSLRSGQDWATRLEQEILASDVLYLFWSRAAAASRWVEKEWRFGLDRRGLDFVDPVPLASPREAPPPLELSSKHFDDRWLAVKDYLTPGGNAPVDS